MSPPPVHVPSSSFTDFAARALTAVEFVDHWCFRSTPLSLGCPCCEAIACAYTQSAIEDIDRCPEEFVLLYHQSGECQFESSMLDIKPEILFQLDLTQFVLTSEHVEHSPRVSSGVLLIHISLRLFCVRCRRSSADHCICRSPALGWHACL